MQVRAMIAPEKLIVDPFPGGGEASEGIEAALRQLGLLTSGRGHRPHATPYSPGGSDKVDPSMS